MKEEKAFILSDEKLKEFLSSEKKSEKVMKRFYKYHKGENMNTKFPNYRYYIMKDYAGNMNEICSVNDDIIKDPDLIILTIEEAVEYNKKNPNKILSLDKENDPKEIIDYVINSGAKYIL